MKFDVMDRASNKKAVAESRSELRGKGLDICINNARAYKQVNNGIKPT